MAGFQPQFHLTRGGVRLDLLTMSAREKEPDVYEDPLTPFGPLDTLVSLGLWPVALAQMGGWLPIFALMDRFFIPGRDIDRLARFVCRSGTLSVGIRVQVQGQEHFQPGQAHVIAFNHVSLLDTPVLVQAVPVYCRTFQEMGHQKIPLYGRFVRLMGQLPVQRGNQRLNEESYAAALEMLRQGKSFGVFPEGHRTRDGKLGRFYPGGFRLAIEAGAPIIPAVTRGLRNLCPAKEWRMRPGKVEVVFGAPIPTADLTLDDTDSLSGQVREQMNWLLRQG